MTNDFDIQRVNANASRQGIPIDTKISVTLSTGASEDFTLQGSVYVGEDGHFLVFESDEEKRLYLISNVVSATVKQVSDA